MFIVTRFHGIAFFCIFADFVHASLWHFWLVRPHCSFVRLCVCMVASIIFHSRMMYADNGTGRLSLYFTVLLVPRRSHYRYHVFVLKFDYIVRWSLIHFWILLYTFICFIWIYTASLWAFHLIVYVVVSDIFATCLCGIFVVISDCRVLGRSIRECNCVSSSSSSSLFASRGILYLATCHCPRDVFKLTVHHSGGSLHRICTWIRHFSVPAFHLVFYLLLRDLCRSRMYYDIIGIIADAICYWFFYFVMAGDFYPSRYHYLYRIMTHRLCVLLSRVEVCDIQRFYRAALLPLHS
jgi:hypothetical protein